MDANVIERNRSLGSKVSYGQIIELQHEMTNKFLQASSSEASITDAQNMMVELVQEPKKRTIFFFSSFFFFLFSSFSSSLTDHFVLAVQNPGSR